jgi:hypothetical protein
VRRVPLRISMLGFLQSDTVLTFKHVDLCGFFAFSKEALRLADFAAFFCMGGAYFKPKDILAPYQHLAMGVGLIRPCWICPKRVDGFVYDSLDAYTRHQSMISCFLGIYDSTWRALNCASTRRLVKKMSQSSLDNPSRLHVSTWFGTSVFALKTMTLDANSVMLNNVGIALPTPNSVANGS